MVDRDPPPYPSPSPYRPPASAFLLKDISNFKTPKRQTLNHNFQTPYSRFYTASKNSPSSSSSTVRRHRPSVLPSTARSKAAAARRLKAFELEQSQSARKVESKKEKSLRSLSKSLTVWLNFLFENPGSCGCDVLERDGIRDVGNTIGKRDGAPDIPIGVNGVWRSPKRQRGLSWQGVAGNCGEVENVRGFSDSMFPTLKVSLKDVCSFDDLTQRMGGYLSLGSCKEILNLMVPVAKSIDEGRLKMKPHCPLVTDFGMKEKAIKTLMCYNPVWLRIGLYIIFGGDSLLPNGNVNSDQEMTFLKVVTEKQFFSHTDLAKVYAYNKKVEGLYRPGYYETLGKIILKRFLLLVIFLDRAKSQSSLPLTYGIDGVDGGSPLLFTYQSSTKSSSQVIHDFLSAEVLHGEGNLLTHLGILGYKVSYQQGPLLEYDFRVTNLFDDLQDGVRLCRAIQLLRHDFSILLKVVVPSDTHKKKLVNCNIAMQYLREVSVPLYDEDGMAIVGDDVVTGDKELVISLLWNIFVHLQLPLLINKTKLIEEISKIRGVSVDSSNSIGSTTLEMLLIWIQAICEKYDFKIDGFCSLVDGKAIWCLLDYYFRKELNCSTSFKDRNNSEMSIMSATDYADAAHNFILSQKLIAILGNFPEVLETSDILEQNGACNERSLVILLVFLACQLIMKKNMDELNFHKLMGCKCQDSERKHTMLSQGNGNGQNSEDAVRKFKAIQALWQDLAERNCKSVIKAASFTMQPSSTRKLSIDIQKENAAKVIQSHFRRRHKYLKMVNAVSYLQNVIRAWLTARQKLTLYKTNTSKIEGLSCENWKRSEMFERYVIFMVERHGFVKLRRSVFLIQRAAKKWIVRKNQTASITSHNVSTPDLVNFSTVHECTYGSIEKSRNINMMTQVENPSFVFHGSSLSDIEIDAAVTIQLAWRNFVVCNTLHNQHFAATKIQSYVRGCLLRKRFICQKQAVIKIQRDFRSFRCFRVFQQYKVAKMSAIIIQSCVRGCLARTKASRKRNHIVVIQRHFRGWLMRRNLLSKREAAIKIQSTIRCLQLRMAFHCHRHAAIEIQRFIRGQVSRNRLLGASSCRAAVPSHYIVHGSRDCFHSIELETLQCSVLKLQRWWRAVVLLRLRTRSAVIIQSHIRGWNSWKKAARERHLIVVIQSHWKGYLARKESRGQLIDLRMRLQKSAMNVDDGMRIINRLVVALSELLSVKKVSGILHTCATLDMATRYSLKCCEKLVDAGAIETLLKLIQSVSRSIPDQVVLKHALSTLVNLTRYPHLTEVLINSPRSVEILLWELLRNKEDGYFIVAELLKKICSTRIGVEAVRNSSALKGLHTLLDKLSRKANNEKRNCRVPATRENTEKRLREVTELLKLTMNG